jgi:hypothetical protein
MAKKEKSSVYIWLVFIVVLAAILAGYSISQQAKPSVSAYSLIAVINDTTHKIVWVGGGALCVPAAPNTHLAYDCVQKGSGSYDCNGTYYNVGGVQINCAGVVPNSSP